MRWLTGILAAWTFLLTVTMLLYFDFSTKAYDEVQEIKKEVDIRLTEVENLRPDTTIININNYITNNPNNIKK